MNLLVTVISDEYILIMYNPSARPATGIVTLVSPEKSEDQTVIPDIFRMSICFKSNMLLTIRLSEDLSGSFQYVSIRQVC